MTSSNRKDNNKPQVFDRLGQTSDKTNYRTDNNGIDRGFKIAGSHSSKNATFLDYAKNTQRQNSLPTTSYVQPISSDDSSVKQNFAAQRAQNTESPNNISYTDGSHYNSNNTNSNNNSSNIPFQNTALGAHGSAAGSSGFSFIRSKGLSFIKDFRLTPQEAMTPSTPPATVGYFAGTAAPDSQQILISVPKEFVLSSLNPNVVIAPATTAASTPPLPPTPPVVMPQPINMVTQRNETNYNNGLVRPITVNNKTQPTARNTESASSNNNNSGSDNNRYSKRKFKAGTYNRDQLARSLTIIASQRPSANGSDVGRDDDTTMSEAAVDWRRKVEIDPLSSPVNSSKRQRASPSEADMKQTKKPAVSVSRSHSPVGSSDGQKRPRSPIDDDRTSRKDVPRSLPSSNERLSPSKRRRSSSDDQDDDDNTAPFLRQKGDYYTPDYFKRPLPPQFRKDRRRRYPVLEQPRAEDRRSGSSSPATSLKVKSNARETVKEPKTSEDHPPLGSPSLQRVLEHKKDTEQQPQQQSSQSNTDSSSVENSNTTASVRKTSMITHKIITASNTVVKPTASVAHPSKLSATTRHNSMPSLTTVNKQQPSSGVQQGRVPAIKKEQEPMGIVKAPRTATADAGVQQSSTEASEPTAGVLDVPMADVKIEPVKAIATKALPVNTETPKAETITDAVGTTTTTCTAPYERNTFAEDAAGHAGGRVDNSVQDVHAAAAAFLEKTLRGAKPAPSTIAEYNVATFSPSHSSSQSIEDVEEKDENDRDTERGSVFVEQDAQIEEHTAISTETAVLPSGAENEEYVFADKEAICTSPNEFTPDDNDDGYSSSDDTVTTALEQPISDIEFTEPAKLTTDEETSSLMQSTSNTNSYDAETLERKRLSYQQRIREMDIDERDDIVMDINPATSVLLADDSGQNEMVEVIERESIHTAKDPLVREDEKAMITADNDSTLSSGTCIAIQQVSSEKEQQSSNEEVSHTDAATTTEQQLVEPETSRDSGVGIIAEYSSEQQQSGRAASVTVPPNVPPLSPRASVEKPSSSEMLAEADTNSSIVDVATIEAGSQSTTASVTSTILEQQQPLPSQPVPVSEDSVSLNSTVASNDSTLALSASPDHGTSTSTISSLSAACSSLFKFTLLNRPYKRVSSKWKVEMTETGGFIYIHKETGEVSQERPVD